MNCKTNDCITYVIAYISNKGIFKGVFQRLSYLHACSISGKMILQFSQLELREL